MKKNMNKKGLPACFFWEKTLDQRFGASFKNTAQSKRQENLTVSTPRHKLVIVICKVD